MATSSQGAETATATPKDITTEIPSSDLEMSAITIPSAAQDQDRDPAAEPDTTAGAAQPEAVESEKKPAEEPTGDPEKPAQADTETTTTNPSRNRLQSEAGLGPATESPIAPPMPTSDRTVLSITLMLTTGARHPYKIDEKYLRSRKVEDLGAEGTFDPREISGYKLKELIWTDWRNEWEPRPASPSSIRLIILGRLVEDKAALKDFPFKLDQTNVVHMTVKPADFLDDDDTGGKGTGKGHSIRGRDDGERGAGCRCVIL